jgi:hypothetical protein
MFINALCTYGDKDADALSLQTAAGVVGKGKM